MGCFRRALHSSCVHVGQLIPPLVRNSHSMPGHQSAAVSHILQVLIYDWYIPAPQEYLYTSNPVCSCSALKYDFFGIHFINLWNLGFAIAVQTLRSCAILCLALMLLFPTHLPLINSIVPSSTIPHFIPFPIPRTPVHPPPPTPSQLYWKDSFWRPSCGRSCGPSKSAGHSVLDVSSIVHYHDLITQNLVRIVFAINIL